jgi:hypothetical protein
MQADKHNQGMADYIRKIESMRSWDANLFDLEGESDWDGRTDHDLPGSIG